MEPKFQTSFIPKKPIVSDGGTRVAVVHDTNVVSLVATIFFVVTLAVSGGLFVYKRILNNQIAEAYKEITAARSAIQPEKIKELIDANSRITATNSLLEKHVVSSKVLLLLQELTLKKLRFTSFTFLNRGDTPTLSIVGEVQTYNALAQQQEVLSKNAYIKTPVFSEIKLSDNGNITVNLASGIDASLISYKKSVSSLSLNQ